MFTITSCLLREITIASLTQDSSRWDSAVASSIRHDINHIIIREIRCVCAPNPPELTDVKQYLDYLVERSELMNLYAELGHSTIGQRKMGLINGISYRIIGEMRSRV